jgi:hypothetical protein
VLEVSVLVVHPGVSFRDAMKRDASYSQGFSPSQSSRVVVNVSHSGRNASF